MGATKIGDKSGREELSARKVGDGDRVSGIARRGKEIRRDIYFLIIKVSVRGAKV